MLRVRPALLAVMAMAALVIAGCGDSNGEAPSSATAALSATPTPPETVTIYIRDLTITAETATTPEERGQGLSDRPSMPEDAGMLFYLGEPRIPGFHMNDMLFPLDFIWISADGVVADLTENVPHPERAGGETISGISPDVAVLYALEVNAGVIAAAGLEIGDPVAFEPDIIAAG